MIRMILASGSPRRKELFSRICPHFEVRSVNADETVAAETSPQAAAAALAERKARKGYAEAKKEGGAEPIVLGSDTVVAFGGRILGKPKDEAEAFSMLRLLSGRTHEVFTGVCFVCAAGVYRACVRTGVTFKNLTDEEIRAYIATGSPMDKAGAYGIQDGVTVEKFDGSYTGVVGLPLEETEKLYKEVMKNVETGNRSGNVDDENL